MCCTKCTQLIQAPSTVAVSSITPALCHKLRTTALRAQRAAKNDSTEEGGFVAACKEGFVVASHTANHPATIPPMSEAQDVPGTARTGSAHCANCRQGIFLLTQITQCTSAVKFVGGWQKNTEFLYIYSNCQHSYLLAASCTQALVPVLAFVLPVSF